MYIYTQTFDSKITDTTCTANLIEIPLHLSICPNSGMKAAVSCTFKLLQFFCWWAIWIKRIFGIIITHDFFSKTILSDMNHIAQFQTSSWLMSSTKYKF